MDDYTELIRSLRFRGRLYTQLYAEPNIMCRAADAIEELFGKVEQLPRWTPVEERLPEDGAEVLCYYEYFRYGRYNRMYKTVDRGYFVGGRFGGEPTNGVKAKVLYWMPLPEPPKEKA